MKTLIICLCFCGVSACHKKGIPTITTRTIDPPAPKTRGLDPLPDLALGKTVFENRCNRCHDLPAPGKYNEVRWDGILSVMAFRARLTNEEKINVTAYIKANSAK